MSIFGYFDAPGQETATFDPGLDALCPYCLKKLERPVSTTSLMKQGDQRSYFYRAHTGCLLRASASEVSEIESSLIDQHRV